MGGLTAAIQARDGGARVTLIEKFPDVTKSSTAFAGGAFQVHVEPYGKYTKEGLIEAFRETSNGLCDLDLVKTFVERIADDFTWLKDELGLPLTPNAGLWINKRGMRFVDESEESDPLSTAIMRQPEGVAALFFDQAIRDRFAEEAQKYEQAVPGVFIQGETIGEIAEKIGFPRAQVEETLRGFNSVVKDAKAIGLEIPKGNHLATAAPLEESPFYAVYPVWVSMNTIWGGLEIDSQAQVLDRDGKPIPGLYAAGAMFGGIFNGFWTETPSGTWTYRGNYHWLAASLQVCLVFGRVAGENAAKYIRSSIAHG
jgi:fumarate reductase flavoprotein subunit